MSFELDGMFGYGFRVLKYDPDDITGEEMSTTYILTDSLFFGLEILLFNTFGNVFPIKFWSRIWIAGYVMVNIYITSQELLKIVTEYTMLNDHRYRSTMERPHIMIMGKLNHQSVWRMLNDIVTYFEDNEKSLEIPEIVIVQD